MVPTVVIVWSSSMYEVLQPEAYTFWALSEFRTHPARISLSDHLSKELLYSSTNFSTVSIISLREVPGMNMAFTPTSSRSL